MDSERVSRSGGASTLSFASEMSRSGVSWYVKGAKLLALNILFASIYILVGKFGLSLAIVNASASAVWPATGIVLVSFLLYGYGIWPGIFLGAFLVNLTTAGTVLTSLSIATGNTLEGIVGAYFVGRYAGGANVFDQSANVIKFGYLVAAGSTLISATIGTTTLAVGGFAEWRNYVPIWLTWWLGDAGGALIVAPVLLLWSQRKPLLWSRTKRIEAFFLLAVLILVSLVVFGVIFQEIFKDYPRAFLISPFLVIIAFRFDQRETATVTALLSVIFVWASLKGLGPLILEAKNESVLLLQTFLGINSAMSLTVSAVVAGRNEAIQALRRSHAELDMRVKERTSELSKAYADLQVEVTERRRSEEKLEQSRDQLDEAQHIAHIGSWEWDISRNTVTWSDELYQIYGLEPGRFEATYEGFLDRVHPEDREMVRREVERAYRDHEPFNFEHRIILPSGEERITLGQGKVVCNGDGQPTRMYGTSQDVTIQRRTERRIEDSQRELRAYIDHMSTMSAKISIEGSILLVNKLAEVASGMPIDELLKMKFTEGPWWAFDSEVQSRVRDAFRRATAGEMINYDERLFVFGKVITINFSLSPVFDLEGRVDYILAEGRDITAQKLAEDALRDSEERFRELVEDVRDYAIFAVDPEGKILTWNSGAENLTGFRAEEVLGTSINRFYSAEDVQSRKPDRLRIIARSEGTSEDEGWRVRKDGTRFWANSVLNTMRDRNGNLTGFTKIMRDLTERKRAEERIQMLGRTVTSMNDSVVITDLYNNVIFINPAFVKAYGYREDEIIGKNVSILRTQDFPAEVSRKIFSETLDGGWQGEIINVKKNGEQFPTLLSTSIIYGHDMKPIALVGISRDITERKRAEEKFRRLLESAPDAMVIADAGGIVTIVNSRAEEMFGYTREEMLSLRIEDLLPHRFRNTHVEHRAGYFHHPQSRPMGEDLDLFGLRKNGEEFPVEISLSPMETAEGTFVTAAIRDITERRHTEERIKMLGHTITSMNECVVITDMQRTITFVNPAFKRTYGYSDEEIVGKNISVLRPPDDPGEDLESIQLATICGGWEGELMNVRKNGDRFPVYLTTSIVRSRSGEPVAMVGTWRDISDRKRALESLRRWGQIFENADFGIAIISSDGALLELMNPRFVEMHGFSRGEYAGRTLGDMFADEERLNLLKHMSLAREKGHYTFESRHVRKDKGTFPVLIDVTAVKNKDDMVLYHILSVQDITERKRMEEQAKEAYRKDVLLKEIHHRVKNNLQTVASMLSLQSAHIKDKKQLNVFAESQNRIRAITLIHEKLYQSSNLSNVGMDEYFDSLVVNLVRTYARRPSTITTHIDAENTVLGVDTAIPCGLIVSELVSNCLKHAFPNNRKGEIEIHLRRKVDGQYALRVSDNGIGFPKDVDFRNTGSMGLQLVDMFIQQLNGTIAMNNHRGTEYTITFKEVVYAERG